MSPTPKPRRAAAIISATGWWRVSRISSEAKSAPSPHIGSLSNSALAKTNRSDNNASRKPNIITAKNVSDNGSVSSKPTTVVTAKRLKNNRQPSGKKKRSRAKRRAASSGVLNGTLTIANRQKATTENPTEVRMSVCVPQYPQIQIPATGPKESAKRPNHVT